MKNNIFCINCGEYFGHKITDGGQVISDAVINGGEPQGVSRGAVL